jgi:outer membrane protein insertion porin family
MGAGYSTFEQTILSFSVAQNNLFGRGQKLAASASFGGRTTAFDIRFTEPWFLDKPLSAGIDIYKGERRFDEYDKESTGGALRFLFPHFLDEFTRISARYAYEDAFVTIIRDPDEVSQVIKDMEGKNVTSSITLGITRNSKDKPWNTTKGSVNSLSIEYAGGVLGGNVYFNKYTGVSTWYYPLWWDTVIMTQGRLGYVVQRPGGDLPTYEKFFLGGINDLRGFEFRSISPVDPVTGDKIGGEKMWLYKLEYRFPFAKEQGVVGIVFFDAGNVFSKDEPFSLEARTSVGTGIRWLSPVGPLRLEYGRNLNPQPGEEEGILEFSVGGLF